MFILPIGHEESSVRRLPWVTFAIIVACVVAFLQTDMEAALEFQPPPSWQTDEVAEITPPVWPAPESPFVRWGLTPANPKPLAFLTHMFMHGGWVHLISNLFLLFLVGPPVEDRWGRPLFAGFYLLAGVFAGASHGLMTGSPQLPLVGASGAIAGVMGVFFLRFWATQIRFFYFLLFFCFVRMGTFKAPAWFMLPLWFANEVFHIYMTTESGVETGVAYWAHVGGFTFGVLVALVVTKYRIEERFIHPAIEEKVTLVKANPVIEQAMQAREKGDFEQGYALLEREIQRSRNDPDLAIAFWDASVRVGRAEAAVPLLAPVIRSCVAKGESDQACQLWMELTSVVPTARVDPASLFKLAEKLLELGQVGEAKSALRQALDPGNPGLAPGLALRIVELTRELDPALALAAARRALEFPDLHEEKRARIQQLAADLEAADAARPAPAVLLTGQDEPGVTWDESRAVTLEEEPEGPADAPAPVVFSGPEPPTSSTLAALARRGPSTAALEKFNDFVSLTRFSVLKIAEGIPTDLQERSLYLRLEGQEQKVKLRYRKVHAIAVGAVHGLGSAPVVVIDLLLNWNDLEAEDLRIVRLRGDRFDPRDLLPSAPVSDGLRPFISLLLKRTRAAPLPDRESARGRPFREFESLESYQREVLQVEA
jgi:membrane associated rhomboid family serine protease